MLNLLNDDETYIKENKDPTNKIQNFNNNTLKHWLDNNYIDNITYKKLISYNGLAPKIYGLPKLHKNGIPLRPIVASYMSPVYKLSKFLSNILINITEKNQYRIKDSWTFKKFIDNITLPKEHVFFSLDVVSLYTNIPIELALQAIEKYWPEIEKFTKIPKSEFIKSVTYILNSNYFQYNQEIYKQKFGVAMGQPISSTIADLVMQFIEEKIIKKLNNITFYKRYVDDIIIAANKNNIDSIFNTFNNIHSRLKFTLEKETNNSINFLDITLIKNINGSINTNWYRKHIKTDRYLNFNSFTTIKYKKSLITSLVDRAILLSSKKFHNQNINKIESILLKNNYPHDFIKKQIKLRINTLNNRHKTKINTTIDLFPNFLGNEFNNHQYSENFNYISLPFVPNISLQIEKVLNKFHIKTAFKNHNTIGKNFFNNLKDNIHITSESNIIYQIDCINCNANYIGQTKQTLKNRLYQHKNSIKKKISTPNKPNTALSDHAVNNFHNFNFNSPKILHRENNLNKRLIYEMIEIKKSPKSINYKTDIEHLNSVYYNFFN